MKKLLLILAFVLAMPTLALAQSQRNPCYYLTSTSTSCIPVSGTNPLPVLATATIGGGFTALTTGTPISVTTGGATGTLPLGTVVIATNVGSTNGAYCALGASASTSSQYLSPGGGWFAFAVGVSTQLTCVTSTSTTTVNMTGGSGLPTGTGGGGGSGGGGGGDVNITAVGGNAVTTTIPVSGTVTATVTGVATAANQSTEITALGTINTTLGTINTNIQAGAGAFAATTPTSGIAIGFTNGSGNLTSPSTSNPLPVTSVITGTVAATQSGTWTVQPGNTPNTTPWLVNQGNQYPSTAVPYTNSATGTTSGAVATLAGAGSVTTYLCGFSVRANATAATTVNIVVSGTISGSLNFTEWVAPLASGLGISEMIFTPCIPASGTNTSIVVTGGAPGSGGVNSTTAWGFKL